jgi:hypothetical protein
MFTVGGFQENCYLVRPEGAEKALLIDPGDEAERLQGAMSELGVEPEAILTERCSPATCSSRARSGAPTCPAPTTPR